MYLHIKIHMCMIILNIALWIYMWSMCLCKHTKINYYIEYHLLKYSSFHFETKSLISLSLLNRRDPRSTQLPTPTSPKLILWCLLYLFFFFSSLSLSPPLFLFIFPLPSPFLKQVFHQLSSVPDKTQNNCMTTCSPTTSWKRILKVASLSKVTCQWSNATQHFYSSIQILVNQSLKSSMSTSVIASDITGIHRCLWKCNCEHHIQSLVNESSMSQVPKYCARCPGYYI